MNWDIEIENKKIKTANGSYTQTRIIVWYDRGFASFATMEHAENFINNGFKL